MKEGGVFLNADKVMNTNEEELERIDYFNHYITEKPHIDTPLSIEHEIEILEKALFKDISISEVDKENYRLLKAYK